MEVPTINPFPTQGSTGGPVGMINVDFINSVDFYSGAFPSNRSGALSAILDFKFKDGRTDRTAMRATVGASEVGVSVEGPIGDDFSYIISARRSYLQFLFKILGQPFLPTYNDINYKFKYKIDDNNQISLMGIGAIDNFELNQDEQEDEVDRYILNNLPVNEQWNYTSGIKYTHFGDNSYFNLILSRFHLHNEAFKYKDNEKRKNLLLNYDSDEMENQVRFEHVIRKSPYKIIYGGKYTHARFKNSTLNKIPTPAGPKTIDFTSTLDVNEVGAFGQVSRDFLNEDLTLSLGVRTDFNDYNDEMGDPVDQLSPRFSASYDLTNQMALNFNTGIYYQQPPYTIMGYKEGDEFVNKDNGIDYISSKHVVAGVDYLTNTNTKITLEGFYKKYDDYPFVLDDSVSLANLGGDFGVVGNSPANSSSEGRAYGAELLVQQKLYEGFYGILAYTLVWSEFTNKDDKFVPSSWDNR
ncbi:MAG: ferric aerobactin receptor, partial [Bacteroidetes bacterium SW_10_40_5]